jgi:hypothetical protein
MIAHDLTSVQPGGQYDKKAAMEIAAALMAQQQEPRDFNTYHNAWQKGPGVSLGEQEAFQNDMGPQYERDIKLLQRALTRGKDEVMSPAEVLMAHPGDQRYIDAFEQAFGNVGLSRFFSQ